jgi:hypothetical protein
MEVNRSDRIWRMDRQLAISSEAPPASQAACPARLRSIFGLVAAAPMKQAI